MSAPRYHLQLRCRTLLDRDLLAIAMQAADLFRTAAVWQHPGREVEHGVSYLLAPPDQAEQIRAVVLCQTQAGRDLPELADAVRYSLQQIIDDRCAALQLRRAQRRHRASKAASARWGKGGSHE